jgi:hypothetical protein
MNNIFYGMFFAWRRCQSTSNQGALNMFSQTLRRAPRIVTTRCLTTIALLLAGSQAAATTISLDFSTLPSAQGWTYFSDGALEADVFSVSGGVLSMNSPLTKAAYYRIDGVVDPALPFTLTTRARALSALSASWGVLSYYVGTPTQVAAFNVKEPSLQAREYLTASGHGDRLS